jgi:CubicO group peptidase (beta-lactamase class C family)
MGRFNLFMTPDAYQKASVNFKHFMAGVKWTGLKHLEHSYTNIHAILLGIFLEMIEFKPPLELESPLEEHSGLASLFKKYLVDPLGLKGTVLEHVPVLHNAVVSLPGLRPGEPSDSVARKTLGLHKRLLGSAGVFTTVYDLAEILEVVLQGELHPTCPIRREFADMVSVPCDEHGSYGHGAGLWHRFRENLEDVQPTSPPKDAFFKSGWAGSFVFGSRSQKVSVSICTDYAFHNHDKPERKKMLHRLYASVVELALRSCQG